MNDVQQFLEAVFESTGDGFLAVVKVSLNDEGKPDWDNTRTMYFEVQAGVPNVPDYGIFTSDCEWYFSPSLFSSRSRRKEYVLEAGVLWVDFDREVDIESLNPRPSIVVNTSPNRCHVYCVLDEALPVDSLESFNRKLAYSYDGDHSGWDANQLLRLPAGVNAKRDTPYHVSLEHIDPFQYRLTDFDHLEEVGATYAGDYQVTVMPDNISEDREAVVAEYGERLSRRTWDILENRQEAGSKRSGALWSIYEELFTLGMSLEQAYVLIKGTPNDKFSHLGGEKLWNDIDRGFSNQRFKKGQDIRDQLAEIDHRKGMLAKEKANKQGVLIADDMEIRGKLFMTEAGDCFYLEYGVDGNILYTVDRQNSDFGMLMFSRYDVNPASNDAAMVIEVIRIRCRTHEPQPVYSVAHYDSTENVCYVNRFDNNYYRIAVDGVFLHHNGDDGVFFLNPPSAKPWEYQEDGTSGVWESTVFSSLNVEHGQPKDVINHILKTWVMSVFFGSIVPVKPILLFYGDPGSGKTVTVNAIAQTILGLTQWAQCFPDKVEDFYLQTSQYDFMFYDNVESLKTWMRDGLDVASTGGMVSTRRLYKNTELVSFNVSCSLAITTVNPKFLKYSDVLERIIPIHVVRWNGNRGLRQIVEAISAARNELMSELLDEVRKCLHVIASPRYKEILGYSYQDLLSDFHAFMRVTCESAGREFDDHFDFVISSRTQDMREHNVIVRCVESWLEDPSRFDKGFTSKFLYDRWSQGPDGPAFRRQFKSPRALGLLLSHKTFELDMAKLGLKCSVVQKATGNEYVFSGSLDRSRAMA